MSAGEFARHHRRRRPPHVTVIIDWDALCAGIGTASLDDGQLISARDARRLACDCKLIPMVIGVAAASDPVV